MHISRYTSGLSLLYILEDKIYWENAFISRKAKKKEDFWEVECFRPFYLPSVGNPRMRANGICSSGTDSSNLSSSTFHKPGLSAGPSAIWNEELNLCCPLQCSVTHTNDPGTLLLLWRLSLTRELGTDRGLSSSNRLQLMLQTELAGFATENTMLPLHLLMYV